MPHAVDAGLQFFVCVQWHAGGKILITVHATHAVLPAVGGVPAVGQQVFQHTGLQFFRLVVMSFKLLLSGQKGVSYYACKGYHNLLL